MEKFKPVFINELTKVLKRKKIIMIFIISVIGIIMAQLAIFGLKMGLDLATVNMSSFPIKVLDFFSNSIILLFIILITIDLFNSEFSNNTIKIAITKPVSRFKIFLAKVLTIGFYILINLMVTLVISLLISIIFNLDSFAVSGVIKSTVAYLVAVLPLFSIAMIVVLIANLVKSGTMVFFISIIILLTLKGLTLILPEYASLFIYSQLDWYNIWISDSIVFSQIIKDFLIMVSFDVIIFIWGFCRFDKRDF